MFVAFTLYSENPLQKRSEKETIQETGEFMLGDISQLLEEHAKGNPDALKRLMPLVYDELRKIAAHHLRAERSDHTLQPTALVHEAYLKLVGQRNAQWQNRAHFFALAAQIMRHILVDHARARHTNKRGGDYEKVAFDEAAKLESQPDKTLIDLDEALKVLALRDPRKCRLVELRYFAGLSIEETAEVLGLSEATVRREWTMAKTWLRSQIKRTQLNY
jgi:RNA polymerase sigma-70 factor, ECF subfamily